MIIIFTALYLEAEPFIKKYQLKPFNLTLGLRLFKSTDSMIILCITGTGPLKASAAAGALMALIFEKVLPETNKSIVKNKIPEFSDNMIFSINFGTCALLHGHPGLYRCTLITDEQTCRDMYPDITYDNGINKAQVISVSKIYEGGNKTNEEIKMQEKYIKNFSHGNENVILDEEAAGLFTGLSLYLTPDKMAFFKVTSDSGISNEDVSKKRDLIAEKVKVSVNKTFPKVSEFIEKLMKVEIKGKTDSNISTIAEAKNKGNRNPKIKSAYSNYEKLCEDLHCSETMKNQLFRLFKYLSLCGDEKKEEVIQFIKNLYDTGEIPTPGKKDGISVLNRIADKVIN